MGDRWRGYAHPELYTMINSGPGASASEPQTRYWHGLAEELTQVDEDLNKKLTNLNATWEGEAADRARSGLTPLALWASDAESASSVMRSSAELQAEYIAEARAKMPEPVEVTTPSPSGWQMAGAAAAAVTGNVGPAMGVAAQAADHEAQEAAQSEAAQRAIETMQSYETSSTWNRDTLGTFVAPPDVVVSSPPPQGGTPFAVTSGGAQADAIGGGGGGGTSPSGVSVPTGGNTGAPSLNGGHLTGPGGIGGGGGGGNNVGNVPPIGDGGGSVRPPQSTTPSGLPPTTTPPPFGGPPAMQPGGNPPYLPNQNGLPPYGNPNGGQFPVTGMPGTGGNTGDVVRGAQPLRGGLPGGMGGIGGMDPDGSRAASQLGRGMGMPGENGVVRGGAGGVGGGATAGGRGGAPGAMGAGGRRADGEDDDEHFAADYLLETDDVFGDDRRVAPTVIGEHYSK